MDIKNYYWSKSSYIYKEGSDLRSLFGGQKQKLEQLVKASNPDSACKAVTEYLEKDPSILVLSVRIDELIEGE